LSRPPSDAERLNQFQTGISPPAQSGIGKIVTRGLKSSPDFAQWHTDFDDELFDRRGTLVDATKQQIEQFYKDGMTPQEAVTKLIEDLEE